MEPLGDPVLFVFQLMAAVLGIGAVLFIVGVIVVGIANAHARTTPGYRHTTEPPWPIPRKN